MEPFFCVLKPKKCASEFSDSPCNLFKTLCSISTCNIIAFTTTSEIMESSGDNFLGFHVYVADINTPWHYYKVASNKFPFSVLEWDVLGKYLLLGDIAGNVQIWIQKDCLLSEWSQLYTISFPGEHILRAVFFHNGKKIQLVSEKKDQPLYMEKFQRVKFPPSVRQFGGVPAEGCLIISFTGMLGAFLLPTEPPNLSGNSQGNAGSNQNTNQCNNNFMPINLTPVTESLGLTRNFCTTADICYGKNGHFLIAVSNGSIKVQCFRVIVKKNDEKITITSHSLPSFFLCGDEMDQLRELKIQKIKWVTQEDADSLIVAANHLGGSLIQLWGLAEKKNPIHKLLQTNKPEVFKTVSWANQAQYTYKAKLMDICMSKLSFGSAPFVSIAMDNSTIHCLYSETLREIADDNLSFAWSDSQNDQQRSKLFCFGPQIGAVDVTWMGQMMVQVDTRGQLYAYKLTFPHQDQLNSLIPEVQTLTLLEYCLITGYDYLDIMLNIKVQYLDILVDRLTENFNAQPASVKQYYYVNFLTMKTNLYRLSISGQSKAHDLTNLLMLHSILITFKSLLRPSDLSCHDKGPAESLALVLCESVPDVDKVLLNLEGKDFTVEPSTLQSLQQLIQFIADLALNILAKLPESRGTLGSKNTGYEISKDIVALNSIRELLVMIRIWGLLKPQCLPVFSRSADNLDILATLFRTLTRLALNPNEPDELLLDECCMLPSQVLIPQLQSVTPRTGVFSPVLQYNHPPLNFTFGLEPECLKFCPELPIIEGGLSNDSMVDSVRHIQLGRNPSSLRRCTRCGACKNIEDVARSIAMKAWELRWGNRCWCGGFWTLTLFHNIN